jgi:hypothetical protein
VNATTGTSVVSAPGSSTFGQSVMFTATVSNASGNGGTPTGSVQFEVDGASFGSPIPLDANGQATTTDSTLSVGSRTITAVYTPTGIFLESQGSTTETVNATTGTSVVSAPGSSTFGQTVTFTATVSNASGNGGTPTGTVQFRIDSTNFGSAVTVDATGHASTSNSALAVGSHTITAIYTPTGEFHPSQGSTTQTVNAATSTSVITSPDPSAVGQTVTFTATVSNTSGNGSTPTGTVQFRIGGINFGSAVAIDATGHASATDSALAVGSHTITAVYSPTGTFVSSQGSTTQAVNTYRLVFIRQPVNVEAGHPISPPPIIAIEDSAGHVINVSAPVTIAIGTNPASGVLSGTTTRTTVAGLVTFGNLSINRPGTGYTLVVSGAGITNATSNPFNILVPTLAAVSLPAQPLASASSGQTEPRYQTSRASSMASTQDSWQPTVHGTLGAKAGARLGRRIGPTAESTLDLLDRYFALASEFSHWRGLELLAAS